MEIVLSAKKSVAPHERGMSLIELMISLVVLMVGVVGSMSLIGLSIGGNGRSKQQSNSTAEFTELPTTSRTGLSQLLEKLLTNTSNRQS